MLKRTAFACSIFFLTACGQGPATGQASDNAAADTPATVADADAFVEAVNEEMRELFDEQAKLEWVRATYITHDTMTLAAKAGEKTLAFNSRIIEDAKQFDHLDLTGSTGRMIDLIKLGPTLPAPNDDEKRAELSTISVELESMYGAGKYCPDGEDSCRTLNDLETVLANSRDYDELLEAWQGWRTVSPPMRSKYQRFAELANEGAQELGFADLGELWKSGYDMEADAFEKTAEDLYFQVKPLYKALHCHVRAKLGEVYGTDKVPQDQPIPAHLLGNMWAQQWNNIYDLLEPYPGVSNLDVTSALEEQKYNPTSMTEQAEAFFTSLNMPELPDTFWERSMFVKPRDRDVVCHASAWPIDGKEDVRIKMCIEPTEEFLRTIYHELGHVYYFLAYKEQPPMFQSGAHDGFHEAIGDTILLSMTPKYLQGVGLVGDIVPSEEAIINQQMKMALEKIAFLPFGKLVDQWRWDVFSGKTTPENFNAAWWEQRIKYQGVAPAVERDEDDFDPGAKYHIPGNTPYTRYFLSFILQFQFHKALCDAAGYEGPLHECSIYDNKEAGRRFWEMLSMGQSEPWPDAFEKLTGTREMNGSAIIDYFQPLMKWLEEQNEGRRCGWEGEA